MTIARSRAIDQLRRRVPEPRDPAGSLALLEGVLRRRFYGGRSQREIAAETGIPLGTVKMRMVQALARLRELIDEEESA